MVIGLTTTWAICAYDHGSCKFKSSSWRGELDTTLYDKVCRWLATGRWFPRWTPLPPPNKKKDKKTTKNNNRPAQYNWNIVVNGVKHHNTDLFFMVYHAFLFTYTLICYMSKTRTIGGVIGSVLASSAVYCGFEPRSGQTKHYKFGFCCFCTNT